MRHDSEPPEITVGLYERCWHFAEYCRGIPFFFEPFNLTERHDKNMRRIIVGMAGFMHKGARAGMAPTRRMIEKHGWESECPVGKNESAESLPTRWVGLTGDGACPECMAKPSLTPVYSDDYHEAAREIMNDIWRGVWFSEEYRKRQIQAIVTTDLINHEAGVATESAYQTYGAALGTALDCVAIPMDVYNAHIKAEPIPGDIEDLRLIIKRHRPDLPDVTDVMQEKDWCPSCQANVIELDEDII